MFCKLKNLLQGYISCHVFLPKSATNKKKQQKREGIKRSPWRQNAGEDWAE